MEKSNNWRKMHGLPLIRYKALGDAVFEAPGKKLRRRIERRRRKNAKRGARSRYRLALVNFVDRGMLNPNEVRQYLGMEVKARCGN